ncbi:cupin domain-containing protein [Roseateles toxinivorans]|uniref:Cupin domain n=1 Tax=Roseateles toxinivorans TaxID=270368 RepID=A0A4R6QKF9_9BURK|nr:cupin domain-containing protein [Roseateles toxinivorans]TDP63413.1 cupin domain [Roseateles toxinivorans]
MTQRESSVNPDGVFEPFSADEVPWEEFKHEQRFGVRFRQLNEFGGGTHIGFGMEELAPGMQAYPAHFHMLEEEHLYVLSGVLTLRLGERRYQMKAGDYVCFPAGQKAGHALLNLGSEPCRYLIVGERNPSEVVVYTDSGRVGVRLLGEGFRQSATMAYWEGESGEMPEPDTGPAVVSG